MTNKKMLTREEYDVMLTAFQLATFYAKNRPFNTPASDDLIAFAESGKQDELFCKLVSITKWGDEDEE